MGAALFTGLICDTITNPLWVIRTRVQSQFLHQEHEVKYKGIFSSGIKIAREVLLLILYSTLGRSKGFNERPCGFIRRA